MARVYQIPSHARLWLALAVVATSLPQLLRGPLWQAGLLILVLGWRALVERQRLALPRRPVRVLLLLATLAGTFHSFGRLHGPEAGTALITSLFALKYLELVGKRDAYVLIVLGYFVCATVLLFYPGPGAALYVLACLLLLTASLAGINHSDTHARRRQHLATAATLLGQALPLAVILFVLVPRIEPLWNLSMSGGQARTGMSDTLSPGQVSGLTESSALAFRVEFQGPMPPPWERYWRGLTYSHFDGTTWSQARPNTWNDNDTLYRGRGPTPAWYQRLMDARGQGESYRYRVIMQPSQRRWLYALAVPFSELDGLGVARDLRLVADRPLEHALGYRVLSVPGARSAATLGPQERALMLSLPEEGNSRAHALAADWRQTQRDDGALVRAALEYFRQQPFHYTLTPPRLAGDSVDAFLFGTRRGFCEHYASSFTFLMRAAGIPARVVGGYQGGELGAGDYLQVRQYDAHAWSEVWLEGRGWVRVDPTGAVAPERVELGLRGALESTGDTGQEGVPGMTRLPVLFQLQQWADYVDFHWQKWVLGYRRDEQLALLQKWLGGTSPLRIALTLTAALALFGGLLAAWVLLRDRNSPSTPLQKEFRRLRRGLARRGLHPPPSHSAAALAKDIAQAYPRAATAAAHWQALFEHLAYRDPTQPSPTDLARLRRRRRALLRATGATGSDRDNRLIQKD